MLMRGGTSKGAFFVADDLPADRSERDQLILRVMGSPDIRQIDGVGGAHPLTTKVAVVSPSLRPEADLDYLFLQVVVDQPIVTDRQNCGNMLAGVGPFALERGLIAAGEGDTVARIHMVNTGGMAIATFPVLGALPVYEGDTAISGVPGTAAPITLEFLDTAGSSSGSLLPTGNVVDILEGVEVTLVDNGMPVVVMRAADLGVSGYESCQTLEDNGRLREKLEAIRLAAGPLMNLGDVTSTTVPKLTMVAAPKAGGAVCTRTFIPHRCHASIGVLGAVSVATACVLSGSTASQVAQLDPGATTVRIEHPSGAMDALVQLAADGITVGRAGIVNTARKLMDGTVFPRGY
jgi:4-oxalomesaconate tautomerase